MKNFFFAIVLGAILLVSNSVAYAVNSALGADNGGTGSTTLSAESVLIGNGVNPVKNVAPGTSGNVLTSNGSVWTSSAPAAGGSGVTASTTASYVVYKNGLTYYAYNATTTVVTSNSNFSALMQSIVNVIDGGSGGGIIHMKPGVYYNTATTTVEGNTNAFDSFAGRVTIQGEGGNATQIVNVGGADFLDFDNVAVVSVKDLSVYVSGASRAFVSDSSDNSARALWQFEFKNIAIIATTTSTAVPINLGNALRGTFENMEFVNTAGCARFYAEGAWNPGDFTWTRSFCELAASTGAVAYDFATTTGAVGYVNQVSFDMAEAIATAASQTFIKGVSLKFSDFHGLNAEQFDVLVDLLSVSYNSYFHFNYATHRDSVAGLRSCRFWPGVGGNHCDFKFLETTANHTVVDDMNGDGTNPNKISGYIGSDTGTASASTTASAKTIIRDIRGYGTVDENFAPGGVLNRFMAAGPFTAYATSTIGAGAQGTGLTVSGGSTTTLNAYFAANVGIGTQVPGFPLEIKQAGAVTAMLDSGAGSNNSIIRLRNGGTSKWAFGNLGSDSSFRINAGTDVGTGDLVTLQSTGNFGIATTSPYAKLSVAGLAVMQNYFASSTTATSTNMGPWALGTTTPPGNSIFTIDATGDNDLYINRANGNIGQGTSSPAYPITTSRSVSGLQPAIVLNNSGAFSSGELPIQWYNSGVGGGFTHAQISSVVGASFAESELRFSVANATKTLTQRMVIDESGFVGIGTTSPWSTLSASGTISFVMPSGGGSNTVCIDAATNAVTENAGTSCLLSTRESKAKIAYPDIDFMGTLAKLKPAEYTYKRDPKTTRWGFIAEDVDEVSSKLSVRDWDTKKVSSIDEIALDFLTVGAIQELISKNAALEKRIEVLESQMKN